MRQLQSSRAALQSLEGQLQAHKQLVSAIVSALALALDIPIEMQQALLSGRDPDGSAAAAQLPRLVRLTTPRPSLQRSCLTL